MAKIGPNTGIEAELLANDIILCCGEDPDELVESLFRVAACGGGVRHAYRGFGCLRLDSFSLVWGGIGTGTLEPLLWELVQSKRVDRIVLVGTAGLLRGANLEIGKAYVLSEAFLAGTALDETRIQQPLHPSFSGLERHSLPGATIVSTDFYYGFTGAARRPGYPPITRHVEAAFAKPASHASLVDMETGQFYFLCHAFRGKRPMEFVAVKGPANPVLDVGAQFANSETVLSNSISAAIKLLGIGEVR
jgi:hypothetical protein